MTTIRVDPSILQSRSQDIKNGSVTLNSISNNLNAVVSGASGYNGQLSAKVRSIAGDATSTANQMSNEFHSLSDWLGNKAQQFLDADNASSTVIRSQLSNLAWMSTLKAWTLSSVSFPFTSIFKKLFPDWQNPFTPIPGNLIDPNGLQTTEVYSAAATDNLRLRGEAGLNGSILMTLPAGAALEAIGEEVSKDGHSWVKVRTADGKVGWVAKEYLIREKVKAINPASDGENKSEEADVSDGVNASSTSAPLTPVPLCYVERIKNEQCAKYAQRRRPDLGKAGGDGGAYNYKNRQGAFQVTNDVTDLTKKIAVGYAIIWDKGDPDLKGTAGYDWGHIAIVEAVEGERVKVSQSNWGSKDEMWIDIKQLKSSYLYVLP